jgi:hypothetical protein
MLIDNVSDIIELAENESVIVQKISKYWNQQNRFDRPDGVLIITNHRIIFITKMETVFSKTGVLIFPLNAIENLEAKRVMLISPAIHFCFEGKLYVFTMFSGANEVVEVINNNIKNL